MLKAEIAADARNLRHGILQAEIAKVHTLLNRIEHQRGHAQFEQRGGLRHIRVSDDDVEAPIVRVHRMRLIARIDDAAIKGSFQRNFLLNIVSALRDLEARLLAKLADPHAPGADDYLAGHEKRDKGLRHGVKIRGTGVLIVLV